MSMDIIKEIDELLERRAEALASVQAVGTSQYSARQVLVHAVHKIREYEVAFADTTRQPKALERIARALEEAAIWGWGNVRSENLDN